MDKKKILRKCFAKQYDKAIYEKCKQYDVISCDIFDTIFVRITNTEYELYSIVDKGLRSIGIIIENFIDKRIEAQKSASRLYGYNIFDIYENLTRLCDINEETIPKMVEIEIEAEYKNIVINETVNDILKKLKDKGKVIIFTSDMYISKKEMQYIMNKFKIDYYNDIFVSCDYKATKTEGTLFKFVKSKYKDKKIIHFGDDLIGDYFKPKTKGLVSVLTQRIEEDKFIIATSSELNSRWYLWGYRKLAPVLYDFINWIYEETNKRNISNILFLTREGAFFKKLFDIIYPENCHQIFYASRRSVSLFSADFNWSKICYIFGFLSWNEIKEMFEFNCEFSKSIESKYNIITDLPLNKTSSYSSVMKDIEIECSRYSLEHRPLFLQYLKQLGIVGDKRKYALVDFGSSGTTQVLLQNILDYSNIQCEIEGYYLGVANEKEPNCVKRGYLCEPKNPHYTNELSNAGFLFENLLLDDINQTIGYKKDEHGGKIVPVFADNSKYENQIIKEVQNGIIEYMSNCKHYNFVPNNNKGHRIKVMFEKLDKPDKEFAVCMGNIQWGDSENVIQYVAKPRGIQEYIKNPNYLIKDLNNSGWKTGFCKRVFKVDLPYYHLYDLLKLRT